ncbi:PDZ domain-containing protein [Streptomyces sp. NRRL S-340]|uniref:PDZ domain-containing protein n=1 Tax=Streptomyces sp. NRRL S-340 TaxID=1463901 RepID=UPI00055D29B8|nr:PDZ domain-containing protein [Streptomyces sp. NRRL S-340]
MEQTALRPKPLPGGEPGAGAARERVRPQPGNRRGRRFTAAVCGLVAGLVLLLAGVGLGAVGATVIGMSRLAEVQRLAGTAGAAAAAGQAPPARSGPAGRTPAASDAPAPVGPALGLEAVDDDGPGARVVGVHVPGPAYSAGLVRGDVLLVFDGTRIDSAADLARAVAGAGPGHRVVLTVRHPGGGYQQLHVTPGVLT